MTGPAVDAAAVEDFDLGDDQKAYFVKQVAPLLSDLSHVMCQERPKHVAYFALQYLNSKRLNAPRGPSTPLVAENVRLREEAQRLRAQTSGVLALAQTLRSTPEAEEVAEDLIVNEVEIFDVVRRGALSGEARLQKQDPHWEPEEKPKRAEQRYRLTHQLLQYFTFETIPRSSLEKIVASAEQVYLAPAQTVFKEKEYNDSIFLVEKGMLECRKKGLDEEGRIIEEVIGKCAPGSTVGKEAIFESGRRRYSVVASEASVLWKVERATVMHFVHMHATRTRARRYGIVRSIPLLHSLTDEKVMLIVDALQEVKLQDGENILVQGEINEKLCIVDSGRCRAETDGIAVGDYGPGATFAELALLQPAVNPVTVTATEPTTLLQLSRSGFTRMCGTLQRVLAAAAEAAEKERAALAAKAAKAAKAAEAEAKSKAKAKK